MRVADVLSMNPSLISFPANDDDAHVEKALIGKYLALPSALQSCGKDTPAPLLDVPPLASLLLQQRELEAHATENDEYYLMDDPKVHGKSKMKKAFCQPGNMEFCPVISVLSAFQHLNLGPSSETCDTITIHRTPENGGDVTYATAEEMTIDFANGSLHPGDLKAAASTLMVSVLERLSESIKKDGEASKGAKALKAFEKKNKSKK